MTLAALRAPRRQFDVQNSSAHGARNLDNSPVRDAASSTLRQASRLSSCNLWDDGNLAHKVAASPLLSQGGKSAWHLELGMGRSSIEKGVPLRLEVADRLLVPDNAPRMELVAPLYEGIAKSRLQHASRSGPQAPGRRRWGLFSQARRRSFAVRRGARGCQGYAVSAPVPGAEAVLAAIVLGHARRRRGGGPLAIGLWANARRSTAIYAKVH